MNRQKYFIRNINEQSSNKHFVYVKVPGRYNLKEKDYFQIESILLSTKIEEKGRLGLIIHDNRDKEEKKTLSYSFSVEESPVTLGRGKCTLSVNYSFFSKVHCSFFYEKDKKKWALLDGTEKKPSTNGLWLMLNRKYEIHEELKVKIGGNIISIKFAWKIWYSNDVILNL